MKRILALLLAVVMTAAILAACGKEEESSHRKKSSSSSQNEDSKKKKESGKNARPEVEDGAELTVWCTSDAQSVTQALCDEFTKAHADKNVKITVEIKSSSETPNLCIRNIEDAADVFCFTEESIVKLIDCDCLAPVFDVDGEFTLDEVRARNSANSVDSALDENGELYAFPQTNDNGYYLVYDKSVVSDADAKTLEGVLAACKKAGRKFCMDASNGFYACVFPFTGGLQPTGANGISQLYNDYDEDRVVDTLKAFSDLFHEYQAVFMSGETDKISYGMAQSPRTVAAGIDGAWNSSKVKEALGDDYGVTKLPTIKVNGEDTQMISLQGCKYFGVKSCTRYPYAAQALANYLTDENAQIQLVQELGWAPTNTVAMMDSSVRNDPALMAVYAQQEYSVPLRNISSSFWSPMSTLGNYLCKENGSKDDIKQKFRDVIE